jgi:hypothetical protein
VLRRLDVAAAIALDRLDVELRTVRATTRGVRGRLSSCRCPSATASGGDSAICFASSVGDAALDGDECQNRDHWNLLHVDFRIQNSEFSRLKSAL